MLEKGKISALQMALMMLPTILATAILMLPSLMAVEAGRDVWISPIWAAPVGLLTVFIAVQLHKQFPDETVIEYSQHIVGKNLGKIIGFLYLFFYLHVNGIILREYMEFISGVFYHNTPEFLILGSMAFVCALAVYGGLEVIARVSLIFVPVIFLLWSIAIALLVPEFEMSNMLPVFEEGIMPSIKGAASPQAWFSEFFLIAFILPFLIDRENGFKWGAISVASVAGFMIITNFAALFIFGDITALLIYPFMSAVAYISYADFFEHLESLVMAIWIAGTFIKISVFQYALVLGTAQWLKLSDYRPMVLPLTFLLVIFAIWSAPNLAELKDTLRNLLPFYLTSIQTVLPMILLAIVLIRKKYKSRYANAQ